MRTTRREDDQKAFRTCERSTRAKKNLVSKSHGYLTKREVSTGCRGKETDFSDLQWTDKILECPVYHPSMEEFEDPLNYLQKIAPQASIYGICKIVSLLKASVPAAEVLGDFEFSTYVQRLRLAEWDINDKITFLKGERRHTYITFKRMADKEFVCRFHHSRVLSPEHLEKKFWQEMTSGEEGTVEDAVNVDGSAFSGDPEDQLASSKWNLKILPKLPNSALRFVEQEVPGITYPMLYIGMLYSMFAWHVEDHYLYSINYLHCGAPKTWYGVPGHAALQFEKLVLDYVYSPDNLFPVDEDGAFKEMAGKTTMFPPSILLQHGVPVYKAVQMPGEFAVTFPKSYHVGFSNGFSCGEAVNFAVVDWFPFGAAASKRYARHGMAAILPFEELICKETRHLINQEGLDWSSAKLGCHLSVKNPFLRHMRGFNNALQRLVSTVGNIISSSKQLPDSRGSVICGACKRDCYLAFLECSYCYGLHCLFHEAKSFNCPCGEMCVLFLREDLRDIEELALKLEEEGSTLDLLQGRKHGENVCLRQNRIPHIQSEQITSVRDDDIQRIGRESTVSPTKCQGEVTSPGMAGLKNGDIDMISPVREGLRKQNPLVVVVARGLEHASESRKLEIGSGFSAPIK